MHNILELQSHVETLEQQNNQLATVNCRLEARIQQLETENAALRDRIKELEPTPTDTAEHSTGVDPLAFFVTRQRMTVPHVK